MTLKKPLNSALLGALLVGGLGAGSTALAAPQGLYSADELTDADVVTQADPGQDIGEVEDVLLDDNMQVRALVIDTGDLLDLGEKQYVIETGNFTVETHNGESLEDVEYVVHVALSEEEITQQPEYTDNWWSEAKQSTREAWSDTKEGANSAWENTKAATSSALTRAGAALEEAGDETQKAAE
ncbi:PRC-barrel domain-containing protein [Halomonas borealis]|uniref:PRC-barrel domain-containing protein n=1 Tax=Halomonas borealis TaxID=2508710 RepID=UPI00109F73BB|nr:PRC-barrel domain-containing protein [Halomonas borealis]